VESYLRAYPHLNNLVDLTRVKQELFQAQHQDQVADEAAPPDAMAMEEESPQLDFESQVASRIEPDVPDDNEDADGEPLPPPLALEAPVAAVPIVQIKQEIM